MFKYQNEKMKVPAYIWMEKEEFKQLTDKTKEQIENLAQIPFIYDHVAIMPDAHQGYGVPIGAVFGSKDVIIPNAVGVDIGCGVVYLETNIPAEILKKTTTGSGNLLQMLSGSIRRDIPTGFKKHDKKQKSDYLEELQERLKEPKPLVEELKKANYSLQTLGGGNHFIQLSEDQNGNVSIMVHSGSRHFGYAIANHFNKLAEKLNKKWFYEADYYQNLAFLPIDSTAGQNYLEWMDAALTFAKENRKKILDVVFDKLKRIVKKYTSFDNIGVSKRVNAHHNYAALENHFNQDLYIHRKGAIRARKNDWGIIPGSMGTSSYIVKGKGSDASFHSASHGAGRTLGRREAKEKFSVQEVIEDLKKQEIVLGKDKKGDVAEEYKLAYKDINNVIKNEKDLVETVLRLDPIMVVKG